ncbi:DUF5688 family protein [Butyrivibrio sp. JL13D10]|uniref:DUF5688 family protein n=1 Tax=Butyrivibrio sp. JL13D10 TaxID=3236815 RepID=UPI0038B59528
MDNKEFYNNVTQKVKDYYGDRAEIMMSDVVKNNGLIKCGLCVKKDGSNCAPTIYLDDFYDEYIKSGDINRITDAVINIFEEHMVEGNVDLAFVADFDAVYEKICYRLVDYSRNEEKLKEMPYRMVADLAVTYHIDLSFKGIEGSIAVSNKLLNIWDATEEDLYEAAMDNTPRLLPARIIPIGVFLGEKAGDDSLAQLFPEDDFLVASNDRYVNGASVILYPGLLAEIGDRIGSDFYIIPSSRHEVILISEPFVKNGEFNLIDMVKSVNDTCVSPEDVLSDNLYHFDRTTENIKKVEYVEDTMLL